MVPGRIEGISVDNRGPLLNIASWICMAAMCILAIVKLGSKIFKVQRLQSDDYLVSCAMLFGIVQCVLVNVQVSAGLGKHTPDASASQMIRLQKATYASQVFYIIALYTARLAVFRILRLLAIEQVRRRVIDIGTVITAVCGFVVEMIFIFHCPAPRTWAVFSSKCMDQVRFWTAEGIIGMIQDAFLALVPVYLLFDVQISRRKKTYVVSSFMVRLVTFPLIILRLISLSEDYSSSDPAESLFMPSVYTEIHMFISIMASCVPFLKPFTDTLQTGLLTSDLRTMTGAGNSTYANMIKMKVFKKDTLRSTTSNSRGEAKLRPDITASQRTAIIESNGRGHRNGLESTSRSTSEEGLVIKQVTTVAVDTHSLDGDSGR